MPLNTTLEYKWISSGDKVPELNIFLEPILVVDRITTIAITTTVTITMAISTSISISITIAIPAVKNLSTKSFQKLRPIRNLGFLICSRNKKRFFHSLLGYPLPCLPHASQDQN